jgi:hypothetical protein
MKFAYIQDGAVHELFDADPAWPEALDVRPVGDEVEAGWILQEDDSFAPPPPGAVDLVAHAADARWRLETGGITVGGVPVLTDDRSKLMIAGARLAAMADPAWTTPWHGADGGIYPLNAAAIVAISDAVSAHVQATFTTFATVKAAIAAGTITTPAEIDAAFAA